MIKTAEMGCEWVTPVKNTTFPEKERGGKTDTMRWVDPTWQLSPTQPLAHSPTSEMGERITRAEVRKLTDQD